MAFYNRIRAKEIVKNLVICSFFFFLGYHIIYRVTCNLKASITLNQYLELTSQQQLLNQSVKPKQILLWTPYWGWKSLWSLVFSEIMTNQCPQSNCIFSHNKSSLSDSDAVIFHLPDVPQLNHTFPDRTNYNQIWIAMTYESPYILITKHLNFKKLNGIFNRTMSYRHDSDIIARFGKISKYNVKSNSLDFDWVNSHESIQQRNYAAGKKRLVAWFVSSNNCRSQSGRENYVRELQNYIPVDIYGSCGPLKCGNRKTLRFAYKLEEDECYKMVSKDYKFVLGFENSLCKDYVTEKLYNNLKLNVIPVVFGASNYSIVAPPKSVIDASMYAPEELAYYLQVLDANDTLYNEYFSWKKDYVVETHDGVLLACDLCHQLHNPELLSRIKVYHEFDKWVLSGCRAGYH